MRFRDYFSLKQILFAVFLFIVLIPISFLDSNTQVKVTFDSTTLFIKADNYNLNVPYDIIADAKLTDLAPAGEKLENGFDNDIIRTGKWVNESWGEYYIVADLDAEQCIVLTLEDGRIFVFNCKNDQKTGQIYEDLLARLNP